MKRTGFAALFATHYSLFATHYSPPAIRYLPSKSSAAAGLIISREPPARFFTSTLPSVRPRGPISTCQGMPIRSAVANFPPARSSRSSYRLRLRPGLVERGVLVRIGRGLAAHAGFDAAGAEGLFEQWCLVLRPAHGGLDHHAELIYLLDTGRAGFH